MVGDVGRGDEEWVDTWCELSLKLMTTGDVNVVMLIVEGVWVM